MRCPSAFLACVAALATATACNEPKQAREPAPRVDDASAAAAAEPVADVVIGVGAALPADPARALVLGRCLICHDDTYFGQQRLTAEQWQKTVVKMRGFGAPVNDEESNGIAAYLSQTFPPALAEATPRLVEKTTIGAGR